MKPVLHKCQLSAASFGKLLRNTFSSRRLYLLLCLLLTGTQLTGCSTVREAATSYTMMASLDAKKYTIYDTSGQFTSGQIVSAYKIISDDFYAEYYELPSVEQADRAFDNNKLLFKSNIPALYAAATMTPEQLQDTSIEEVPYFEDSASGSNFDRYCLATEDFYYAVSRIDHTLVYISTERKNLKEANKLLRTLGYY